MDCIYIIWLILIVAFVAVEAGTVALTSIWFASGAVVALLLSIMGVHVVIQIVAFLAVSALLLVFTRPLAQKYLNSKRVPTNADRVIGMTGIVTAPINNLEGEGEVHLDGKRWTARSESGGIIAEGQRVEVLRIEGVKVIVRPTAEVPAATVI